MRNVDGGMRARAMTAVSPPAVGERARTFDLVSIEGGRVRSEDLRGRAFLLVFLRHAG
jgi:peroxiredoxin